MMGNIYADHARSVWSGRWYNCFALVFSARKSVAFFLVIACCCCGAKSNVAWGEWIAQGPGPTLNGQVENILGGRPVVGAAHTVAAHPTDADTIYLGGTNGGIWKTTNAFDNLGSPHWTPLTDFESSLSIGALEFDPTDPSANTLLAGIGRFSSFGRSGGDRTGLLHTADGGSSWSALDGGGVLRGKNISGVAARGNTMVVSVNFANNFTFSNIGIFRSTNGGATFSQISNGDGSATGLPGGSTYDLASDPTNSNVLYTGTVFSDLRNGQNGIYRSTNAGASWSKVSDPMIENLISNNTSNFELAVGNSGEVYAAIINNGNLDGLFRSPDGNGGSWLQLDLPSTNENGTDVGLNPRGGKGPGPGSPIAEIAGGNGNIHFSIRPDPVNSNIVYVGGDRQPRQFGDTGRFPNSIGARDFSGRLFRGDASQPAGSQFVHLTHSNLRGAVGGGTARNSAPHADSREIVFAANGQLVEVDDGGIYRRTSPQSDTGDWYSLNGDLQITEFHDVAYDSLNNRIVGGAQDTGTALQVNGLGNTTWDSISTADGGDVAVDNTTIANHSVVYSSFQNFGSFRRRIYNASGNLLNQAFPSLISINSSPEIEGQFVTPLELSQTDQTQLLIGGKNGLYESLDRGGTVNRISTLRANSNAMVYGGRKNNVDNDHVLYVGSDNDIFRRIIAGGVVSPLPAYPGGNVEDLDVDSEDWGKLFVADSDQVFFSDDSGASFADITGDLVTEGIQTLEFVDLGTAFDALLVGSKAGVFFSLTNHLGFWQEFGATTLPNAPVFDLVYDAVDDLLIAATLGRGAWTFANASAALSVPEPGTLAIWFTASGILVVTRRQRGRDKNA